MLKININLQNHSHIPESSLGNYYFSLEKIGHIATVHQLLIKIKEFEMMPETLFALFYKTAFSKVHAAITFSMW